MSHVTHDVPREWVDISRAHLMNTAIRTAAHVSYMREGLQTCVIHARGTSNIPICNTTNVSYTPHVQRCVCMRHTRLMCTAVYASYIHCATRALQTYHVTFVSAATRRALFGRSTYGVATISRLLKMIGLFCKRALLNR